MAKMNGVKCIITSKVFPENKAVSRNMTEFSVEDVAKLLVKQKENSVGKFHYGESFCFKFLENGQYTAGILFHKGWPQFL